MSNIDISGRWCICNVNVKIKLSISTSRKVNKYASGKPKGLDYYDNNYYYIGGGGVGGWGWGGLSKPWLLVALHSYLTGVEVVKPAICECDSEDATGTLAKLNYPWQRNYQVTLEVFLYMNICQNVTSIMQFMIQVCFIQYFYHQMSDKKFIRSQIWQVFKLYLQM